MFPVEALFGHIFQVFLTFLRVGSVWMFFPVLGQNTIPANVRLAGGFTLAMALHPMVHDKLPMWDPQHLPGLFELIAFVLREFLIGAGMGLVARWSFATIVGSAQWVGMQMGFSQGSIVNPEFGGGQESAWAAFLQWIGIMLFLGLGGHWLIIEAIAQSYNFDMSHFYTRLTDPKMGTAFWIEVGTQFFAWMLKLSGPLVAVLLLLQAAMGVLSRFVPQINIWFVSIPITIGTGVFVFSILSPMYGDALGDLFKHLNEGHYMWLSFVGTR